MKNCVQEISIIKKHGGLFTTSLDIAEKFGKQHKNVLNKIAEISRLENEPRDSELEMFARLNFKETFYTDDRGKLQPMFDITRSGFTILAMGFTGKKALEWKIKYDKAFSIMEQTLLNKMNISWQEQRSHGKLARRSTTDAVQSFIEYAKKQGSSKPNFYYKHITTATYKALFIVQDKAGKSFRDMLDTMQLSFLQTAEYVAAKALADGMEQNLYYKDIFVLAKKRIEAFAGTVPTTGVIGSGQLRIDCAA